MTGRSLNVISLAGLAFAVGMVLDAAIVVLENIVRLRSEGHRDAELTGTMQVWGAMLASTATTVAIFLPVMFIDDVEGQLFADLALTIAIAVVISFFVATTVLPVAAQAWLPAGSLDSRSKSWDRIAHAIARFTDVSQRRWGAIIVLMSVPIIATVVLLPNTDYLPPVKRDSIDAFINLPGA